jgi:hypothetical protein
VGWLALTDGCKPSTSQKLMHQLTHLTSERFDLLHCVYSKQQPVDFLFFKSG